MTEWRAALAESLEGLTHHKMRTALTLLGMIFGVAAVIAMLSIGAGAERIGGRFRDAERRPGRDVDLLLLAEHCLLDQWLDVLPAI